MRLAGPRPAVPPQVQKRVYDAVQAEWRSTLRQRRTMRWGVPAALAASVLLAVALSNRGPEVRSAPIAMVALAEGNAGASAGISPGDPVYPGDTIATGDGGLALTVRNGLSLRFDEGTTATFDSIGELTLQEGRIYADTGSSVYDARSITVRTRVGSARDVGTRFAVAYADGDMSVAVREGRVDVSHSRGTYTADAGQLLKLGSGADVALDQISIYDSSWDWAAALAPAFDLENHSLLDFLKWAARETGKELVFENDATRLAATGIRPRGSTEGFTPIEAIDSVLATTRLGYRVDARQIVISDAAR
jgi:ferric-dicitrate binding protein FerR (iron transport regulator)